MSPIRYLLPAFLAAALLLASCGGGGTGGGGGGGGGGIVLVRAECVSQLDDTVVVDPLNLQVTNTARFVLASYDDLGTRTVSVVSGWNASDGKVSVTSSNGDVSALTTSTSKGQVQVTVGLTQYTMKYFVHAAEARVSGRVVAAFTSLPADAIHVLFYDQSLNQVGEAYTGYDGRFNASVPTTAKAFHIDYLSIDTSKYYNQYSYLKDANNQAIRYTTLDATCVAPLPSGLTNGSTTPLLGSVVLPTVSQSPPGPPTGCSG